MSPSASVPAIDMTQTPDSPAAEPPAPAAAGAATAGRADRPARRARAAASEMAPTGVLITIIVLLAGAVGGLLLRDLNRIDADIADLNPRFETLQADIDARFEKVDARFDRLEADIDARFEKVDARFDTLEADIDARFEKLEAEMDARFKKLEEGQQQIALTLTALIAFLGADDAIDAALSGDVPGTATGPGPDASTDGVWGR